MEPTIVLVNGIKRTINIMKGIERKTLTIAEIIVFIARFSHKLPFAVKNNNKPNNIPITNVAITDQNDIYIVSLVASHIETQSTFGKYFSSICLHHL